jgi:hypothetical protein
MTLSRFSTALVASMMCVGMTSAKIIHFSDQARDPGVKDWIWYQVLGPSNSPYMIVYLSRQHFKPYIGEELVVLPTARYDIVSSYTQARMARSDCPGKLPTGDVWYTVQIAEHGNGLTRQCILPQRLACEYLSGVEKLGGVNWTAKEVQPIARFMNQIKCKTGVTSK